MSRGLCRGLVQQLLLSLCLALAHILPCRVDCFRFTPDDLIIAIPVDEAHVEVVKAGRAWRKGIRTLVATNKQPTPQVVAEGKAHNETWIYYPDDNPLRSLYAGDSRAALVPFLAHREFAGTYKWMLYGDDDTIFFVEGVFNLLEPYDPSIPYFITDHLWWSSAPHGKPTHPNTDGPVCLPCHFNPEVIDSARATWTPPKGCPCTPKLLCETDTRKIFNQFCDIPRAPARLYSMHGGAGALISNALLEAVPFDWMEACVKSLFSTGGDAFISICLWQSGFALTHPEQSFYYNDVQHFDPGPEDRMGVMLKIARALDHKCDGPCQVQLDKMVTLHVRSRMFPTFEQAGIYIQAMSTLYQSFTDMRTFHRAAADAKRATEQAELAKSVADVVAAAQPAATRRALMELTANFSIDWWKWWRQQDSNQSWLETVNDKVEPATVDFLLNPPDLALPGNKTVFAWGERTLFSSGKVASMLLNLTQAATKGTVLSSVPKHDGSSKFKRNNRGSSAWWRKEAVLRHDDW